MPLCFMLRLLLKMVEKHLVVLNLGFSSTVSAIEIGALLTMAT